MPYKNILVQSAQRLHVHNNCLEIGGSRIPLEDINAIMLDHPAILVSVDFVKRCAQNDIAVYTTDDQHIPSAMFLAMPGKSNHLSMLRFQISASKPLSKRMWKRIVEQKIHNQSLCLKMLEIDGWTDIELYRRDVLSGDSSHVEAGAAAAYFRLLYDKGFKRREETFVNACMNYGYAIVRGMIARSLVLHGLEPSIGIGHYNKINAFNLADDLIEPFRGFVDYYINDQILRKQKDERELTPGIKRVLVSIMNYDVRISGQYSILQNGIDVMVESYCRSLQSGKEELVLPELCSLQVHKYE